MIDNVPIPCAAGCDNGRVITGRLLEVAGGRWLDETEPCQRCRGTGHEPCEICGRETGTHPAVVREECDLPGGMPVCEECHELMEREREQAERNVA